MEIPPSIFATKYVGLTESSHWTVLGRYIVFDRLCLGLKWDTVSLTRVSRNGYV